VLLYYWGSKQLKIASFLAMTTIFMAEGRSEQRQRKTAGHCES